MIKRYGNDTLMKTIQGMDVEKQAVRHVKSSIKDCQKPKRFETFYA